MNQQFISEIGHLWGQMFLEECAKIAECEPWLDDEEREAKAEERVNKYNYIWNKERLNSYWNRNEWRSDLR